MNYPNYNPYANAYGGFGPGQGFPAAQQGPMFQQQGPQMPVQPGAVQAPAFTQPVSQPGFVCRPVASLEEAKAVPTDFSGNMLVMTDLSHGAIYTKVLDPASGSSRFEVYQRAESGQGDGAPETAIIQPTDYTPHFTALEERLDQVSDRVEDLFDRIESQKKAAMRAERKAASGNE